MKWPKGAGIIVIVLVAGWITWNGLNTYRERRVAFELDSLLNVPRQWSERPVSGFSGTTAKLRTRCIRPSEGVQSRSFNYQLEISPVTSRLLLGLRDGETAKAEPPLPDIETHQHERFEAMQRKAVEQAMEDALRIRGQDTMLVIVFRDSTGFERGRIPIFKAGLISEVSDGDTVLLASGVGEIPCNRELTQLGQWELLRTSRPIQ
jgi:hypothetical protein